MIRCKRRGRCCFGYFIESLQKQTDDEIFKKKLLDDCLMIAVSYLMKRKTKKIFVEVIFNIKISYIKFWLFDFSNDQNFAKLTGGLDKGGTGQCRIR